MGWDGDDTTLGILTAVINEKKESVLQPNDFPPDSFVGHWLGLELDTQRCLKSIAEARRVRW